MAPVHLLEESLVLVKEPLVFLKGGDFGRVDYLHCPLQETDLFIQDHVFSFGWLWLRLALVFLVQLHFSE